VGKGTPQKSLKREFSAGGVVFKKEKDLILWLITQHTPSKRVPKPIWRLPKGWVDNKSETVPGEIASGLRRGSEEEIRSGALREVREEGGVEAKIIKKLGTTKFFFTLGGERILKFVTFNLMQWLKDLDEGPSEETQAVEWLSFGKAYKKLEYSSEKEALKKANETIEQGIQENLL
jgi:ADP-ribose pyrophosphatase YjhB (NUDIX family)